MATIAAQLGETVAPGPLHPFSTVLAGLVDAADRDAHRSTIESLASCELAASWAVYEPHRSWSSLDPGVTATCTESGYLLDGVKDRVEAGGESEVLLVVARCEGAVRQFLVSTVAPGLRIDPELTIDFVKRYARVHLDGVRVPRSASVGAAEQTQRPIERQSQIAQILQCAEVVGVLETVLDFTVQWAFDRHTFGRPLASYQAPKHRFADIKMWLEACRAATAPAVSGVASRSRNAGLLVSVAKTYVGERACRLCRTASNCTAGSASPGSMISISTSGGPRCTGACSVRRKNTTSASTRTTRIWRQPP